MLPIRNLLYGMWEQERFYCLVPNLFQHPPERTDPPKSPERTDPPKPPERTPAQPERINPKKPPERTDPPKPPEYPNSDE